MMIAARLKPNESHAPLPPPPVAAASLVYFNAIINGTRLSSFFPPPSPSPVTATCFYFSARASRYRGPIYPRETASRVIRPILRRIGLLLMRRLIRGTFTCRSRRARARSPGRLFIYYYRPERARLRGALLPFAFTRYLGARTR